MFQLLDKNYVQEQPNAWEVKGFGYGDYRSACYVDSLV